MPKRPVESYTTLDIEVPLEITLPKHLNMKFNRLVLKGGLSVKKVQPPGAGAFLAGPYTQSLPTIGPVGGADPSVTDTDGYNTITALIAAEVTDTVTLPADIIYEINAPVQLPDGKRLCAADGTSVTIKRADNYSGNLLEAVGLTDCTVSNITFDGNRENNLAVEGDTTVHTVYSDSCTNFTVEHCRFFNTPYSGAVAHETTNAVIRYNVFDECYLPVIVDGGEDVTDSGSVTGNSFVNTDARRSHTSLFIDGSNNLQVFHNTFIGAGLLGPVGFADGIYGSSIRIHNSAFFTIENNTCEQSQWASFIADEGSTTGVVKHNYFCAGVATVVGAWIFGTGSDNVFFTLNAVDGTVSIDGNYSIVSYNNINAYANGVEASDAALDILIEGNSINRLSGTGDGVLLFDKNTPSVNCRVIGNTITGFTNAAIGINNTGNTGVVFNILTQGNTFTSNNANYSIPTGITLHVSVSLQDYTGEEEPPASTESEQGTTIPSFTQLIDASGQVWTVASGVIFVDGNLAGFSQNVTLLLYYNHTIYQQNQAGGWWSWGGNGIWNTTTDPRGASSSSSVPVVIPSITVEGHPHDLLQVGNEATDTYFVEDNRWGIQGYTEGTGASQYQQAVGRSLQVGSAGEVAFRMTWRYPQFVNGVDVESSGSGFQEVKAYPQIIYGRKPGYVGPGVPWPAYDFAVRLPDGASIPAPSGIPGPIASAWVNAGGSMSTRSPSGDTPGTDLPKQLPISAAEVLISGRFTASAVGKGHLSFDIWLQDPAHPEQTFGDYASPKTHEIMVPLRNWGDYGRHPGNRGAQYLGPVTIDGIPYHLYAAGSGGRVPYTFGGLNGAYTNEETGGARTGWKFIVFQHEGVSHPLGSDGKFHINVGAMLTHLKTVTDTGGFTLVQGTEHLVSIELGVEPVYGQGDCTVYDFRVEV